MGGRVVGHDQVLVGHQVLDQPVHRQVVDDPDVAHEAQCLAAHLVVEDELRETEHQQEIQHPGTGHGVDPRQGRDQGAPERLRPCLCVEDRPVREGHVRLGREAERLGDRNVGSVQLECLDGRHRRACDLHVEGRRRSPEEHRRPGPDDLGHGDPGQHISRVEDRRADDRHGRDEAHEGDRHDLHGDAGLDAIDEVLAGVLAVPEVAGRGDREDGHRPGDQVGPIATEELHHLDHARDAMLRERARHDRFVRVRQGHVQAPGVRDVGLDVVVGREGRGQIRDIGQAVADADVLDEVRGIGQTSHSGPVVEDLEPRRSGHEMDPIATDVGVSLAGPVVQPEG